MKIKLELEDFRLATTRVEALGDIRWLIVRVEGKPFAVWRQLDERVWRTRIGDEYVDQLLVEKMEFMLRKVFVDALKAIPEGTQILNEEVK